MQYKSTYIADEQVLYTTEIRGRIWDNINSFCNKYDFQILTQKLPQPKSRDIVRRNPESAFNQVEMFQKIHF